MDNLNEDRIKNIEILTVTLSIIILVFFASYIIGER